MICPVWKRVVQDSQFDLVREFVGTCSPTVKRGDKVDISSVVAHCEISAGQRLVRVAHSLGIGPKNVSKYLLRNVGTEFIKAK